MATRSARHASSETRWTTAAKRVRRRGHGRRRTRTCVSSGTCTRSTRWRWRTSCSSGRTRTCKRPVRAGNLFIKCLPSSAADRTESSSSLGPAMAAAPLDGRDAVSLLVEAGLHETAVNVATTFGAGLETVFEDLTRKCLAAAYDRTYGWRCRAMSPDGRAVHVLNLCVCAEPSPSGLVAEALRSRQTWASLATTTRAWTRRPQTGCGAFCARTWTSTIRSRRSTASTSWWPA